MNAMSDVNAPSLPDHGLSDQVVTDRDSIDLIRLVQPGVEAVRRFWRSFLLIQSCALLLLVSYFCSADVRAACGYLSEFHHRGGLLLSAIAAGIAGGILPEIAKAIFPPSPQAGRTASSRLSRGDLAFVLAAFAVNGIVTDLQYRILGYFLGNDDHFSTAVKKMLADQFITTPVYGIVYWAVIYRWKAHRFRVLPLLRELGPRWYLQQVGPLLIPCWCFWIPMVLMVYLMPANLQFSLFCLALAAWSLLMVFVASSGET
jgi:hypothetical protein